MTAIGIFDSGIGGLTVLRALREALPNESFDYLGDTARLPYGSKSPRTIRRYLDQNIRFLRGLDVKALVVACNSASTVIDENHWDNLPIYGVIEPGAKAALEATRGGTIGVLGTRATVASQAYPNALHALNPKLNVVQQACPLLVPLVEEGWENDEVTKTILTRYLEAFDGAGVDTLILGCTHYPVLKQLVQDITGDAIALVDSADVMANLLRKDLSAGRFPARQIDGANLGVEPSIRIWTTDTADTFHEVGTRILCMTEGIRWQLADLNEK